MDIVIPIAFPDYQIAVGRTPAMHFQVPDFLPYVDILPNRIDIQAKTHTVGNLGHAGVLFINGQTGTTKYYEYGRYDAANLGLTRRVAIPDTVLEKSGEPSHQSLIKVLNAISAKAGHHTRIKGAYIKLEPGSYAKMLAAAQKREAENRNAHRKPYTITGNSCMHFSKQIAEAGGATMPWIADPRPNSFIEEVQSVYPPLEFKPPTDLTIGAAIVP